MTAPLEAYVSVLARDLHRELAEHRAEKSVDGGIAVGEVRGVLVMVAVGPIAGSLKEAFQTRGGREALGPDSPGDADRSGTSP